MSRYLKGQEIVNRSGMYKQYFQPINKHGRIKAEFHVAGGANVEICILDDELTIWVYKGSIGGLWRGRKVENVYVMMEDNENPETIIWDAIAQGLLELGIPVN